MAIDEAQGNAMTAFKLDRLSGLLPRVPESLLPPTNATVATNCEFSYGELRNIKGDYLAQTLSNSPVSLYTDNGLTFYSWPEDVNAVRSPLASDIFDRLYFTTPTDFRVTTRSGMSIAGGVPASSYRVGVPRPTLAPTVTVTAAPGLDTASIAATFHYEYGGVKYLEGPIALTGSVADRKWTFTPPSRGVGVYLDPPPEQSFAVVRLVATDNSTHDVLFDVYTGNSTFAAAGAWALSLSQDADGTSFILNLASSAAEEVKETRAYVYTYVNTYGEEGPPSPPTVITAMATLPFTVGVTRDALTADYAPIKEIRVYRTPTGSEIADYFYSGAVQVLTAPGAAFQFIDTTTAAGLNEPLASSDFYPPSPALVGVTCLPNGILMAWKGNELHFSEAYKPWSWPPQYVKTFRHNIVGGIAHGSGALITTLSQPFFISGVSPDSMTEGKVNSPQAGVSKWAMADLNGMIAYASNDGIVVVDGNRAVLDYSEQFFTRDVWRTLYRAGFGTMRFCVWDGRLVVYSSANAFTPFMIRLDEAKGSMTELPALFANCSFVSPIGDQFYYARGNGLYQFGGGTDVPATWKSREMVMSSPVNFGVAQVICEGAWTLQVFAKQKVNNVFVYLLVHTKGLTGDETFRLPGGFKSDRWKIAVEGTGRFRELRVAETPRELGAL